MATLRKSSCQEGSASRISRGRHRSREETHVTTTTFGAAACRLWTSCGDERACLCAERSESGQPHPDWKRRSHQCLYVPWHSPGRHARHRSAVRRNRHRAAVGKLRTEEHESQSWNVEQPPHGRRRTGKRLVRSRLRV